MNKMLHFRRLYLRIFLSILGLVIFLASAKFGYCLLMAEKLSGSEFVSLLIAFALIGLILSFASEIQEFSIAGNIVKLKEVKKDAEKSISELKAARTETYRFLLILAKRYPGGFSDGGTVDSRISDFWNLYDQIVSFGCKDELASNLLDVVNVLIKGQLTRISKSSDSISSKYSGSDIIPEPAQLTIEALDNDSVEKAANRMGTAGGSEQMKRMLIVGLDEYKKLYELRQSLQVQM
ncbi:hypothetical protein E2650_17350 [Shewanella xiamenensis]|uniref:Uncharacterized protein n=1 Tax=Shewanella xiamenensis TaxID=332186 RepID=A0AAW6R1S4_9GAMM|nr:hypothetical protein [Shewanella xiamenensis]MDG5901624.1 hypothetical protein [Shewanella xiamenensis]